MNYLEQYASEFYVEPADGYAYISQRGLARLIKMNYTSWKQGDGKFTQKIDAYLAAHGFEGDGIINSQPSEVKDAGN